MVYGSSYRPGALTYNALRTAYLSGGGSYIAKSLMNNPVVVGQGKKFGYGYQPTRTMTKTKRKYSGSAGSLKQKIRAMETVQHSAYELLLTMSSNINYTTNPVGQIPLGNSNLSRTNDEIYLEALKLNYVITTPTAWSNGVKFRLQVLWLDNEVTAQGTAWLGGLISPADIYLSALGSAIGPNGIIDPKKCTIVHDEIIAINASFASMQELYSGVATVQLKKAFVYKPTSAYGKDRNLYIRVQAYGAGATTGVTDVCTVALSYDLIFRNSK